MNNIPSAQAVDCQTGPTYPTYSAHIRGATGIRGCFGMTGSIGPKACEQKKEFEAIKKLLDTVNSELKPKNAKSSTNSAQDSVNIGMTGSFGPKACEQKNAKSSTNSAQDSVNIVASAPPTENGCKTILPLNLPSEIEEKEGYNECSICLTNKIDPHRKLIFGPCGHGNVCSSCIHGLIDKTAEDEYITCPMCRAQIAMVITDYCT